MQARWILPLLAMSACATQPPPRLAATPPPTTRVAPRCVQTGLASWYRVTRRGTATGERPSASALVAAHRTLPMGTPVRVTDLANGQSVVVRIADRGPFGHGRIIDLSAAAAAELGMRQDGVAQVRLEVDPALIDVCPFDQTNRL